MCHLSAGAKTDTEQTVLSVTTILVELTQGLRHPRFNLIEHAASSRDKIYTWLCCTNAAMHDNHKQLNSPATIGPFLEDWLLKMLNRYLINLFLPHAETLLFILQHCLGQRHVLGVNLK